jgi:hypothetical protein
VSNGGEARSGRRGQPPFRELHPLLRLLEEVAEHCHLLLQRGDLLVGLLVVTPAGNPSGQRFAQPVSA